MSSEKKPNEGFSKLTEEELEASTIFGKPQIIDKKPPKKKRKNISVVLMVIAVPLLIAAIVFGSVFLKDTVIPETEKTTSSEAESELINVTENALSNVKGVVLENVNGKFSFYPEKSNVDSEGDEGADALWYLKGVGKEYTDTEFTGLTVKDCATFLANEEYEGKDVDFSEPSAKIKVDLKEGKDYEIVISALVGEDAKIGGAYAKYSESDKIFFLKKDFVEYFTRDQKYYIDYVAPTAIKKTKKNADYFGEGLESFDYIELSGADARENYRFEMYEKDGTTRFKMVSPCVMKVKTAAIHDIFSLLKENLDNTGITGILHYDGDGIDAKTLKKFGLDKPSAVIEYKVADEVKRILLQDIKVADPETDNYEYSMMVEGVPVIYEVTKNSFDYLGFEVSSFATDAMIEEDISELKSLRISLLDKAYSFSFGKKTTLDEETEEETTELTVKYDGKVIDGENFNEFYSEIKLLKPFVSSLLFERPEGAREFMTISLENADPELPSTELKVFLIEGNESRCYLELDGNPVGLAELSKAEKTAENLLNVINNRELS